jgi:hypothetical protein
MANDAGMADEQPLKVVGHPRALGEKLTLYEVAPGDTVILAEQVRMELQAVVTGMATTRTMAAPAGAPVAVPAAPETRGAAKLAPTQDSQRAAQSPAALPPPPPPAAASVSFAQTPDGMATLSWKDPVTGSITRLSGRHTRAELEEIRHRIERAKRAAADSTKRTP